MASFNELLTMLKFKNLVSQLTETEFDVFLSKFSRAVGREEMLELLCKRFLIRSGNFNSNSDGDAETPRQLMTMTDIASNIIRSRDSAKNACALVTISDMPSSMVGEVASYLDQMSYAAFSRTNRKLFVDTNSPNRLVAMNLRKLTDDTIVRMDRFNQTRYLIFNLKSINQFESSGRGRFSGFHKLKTLLIYGKGCTYNDVIEFINDPSLCFASVSSLVLRHFSQDDTRLNAGELVQILSKFDELHHLKIFNVHGYGTVQSDRMEAICRNLKEMDLRNFTAEWIPSITRSLSQRLETLTMGMHPRFPVNASDCNFGNLQRLCLCAMSIDKINSLLNISKSLRKISWIPNACNPPAPTLDDKQVQSTTRRCIVDQPLLEFLYISTRGHLEDICSGIHRGLFTTKKQKRKCFELTLDVDVRELRVTEEFVCAISKIMDVLGRSDIDEWVFRVNAHHEWGAGPTRQTFDWVAMHNAMKELESNTVKILYGWKGGFGVGNIQLSKLRPHSFWWYRSMRIGIY